MRTICLVLAILGITTTLASADSTSAQSSPMAAILFVPFPQIGPGGGQSTFSQAIQEDLMAETAKITGLQPMALDKTFSNSDAAAIMDAARERGAVVVVFGSYQISGDQIRVKGQMTEVATGRVIRSLYAVGNTAELFSIEDALATDLRDAFLPPLDERNLRVTRAPLVGPTGDGIDRAILQDDINDTQTTAPG